MKRTTLIIAVLGLLLSACGTTKNEFQNSTELEGRPPTPEEDPFFYAARPPESAKAETRGTIGDAEDADDDADETADEPADEDVAEARRATEEAEERANEPPPKEIRKLRERLRDAEAEALALRAENLELKEAIAAKKAEKSAPASSDGRAQCHACVKICPAKGNCRDDAEMICGWGTGAKKADAMLRATSECDGALDQYRENGPYAKVEGNCPVAKCL